jgi:hypothetical protein
MSGYKEILECHIDGITYRIPRRKFKKGHWGFYMMSGGDVHGRKSRIQVLVEDMAERAPADAARARERNRAGKRAKRALGLRVR